MASPILWQNDSETVTLLDVPRSIEAAQGTLQQPCHDHILSVPPIQLPFPSNEPKTAAAKAKLAIDPIEQARHDEYAVLLQQAMEEVRSKHEGDWCLPRPFVLEMPQRVGKRKRDDANISEEPLMESDPDTPAATELVGSRSVPSDLLPHLAHMKDEYDETQSYMWHFGTDSPNLHKHAAVYVNTWHMTSTIRVNAMDIGRMRDTYRFRCPPWSHLALGDCSAGPIFNIKSPPKSQRQPDDRAGFDFVLLDPPWPSRSVKRTHQTPGSTYNTVSTLDDMRALFKQMKVGPTLGDDCLVGVWLTNKAAVRELVLGKKGLFKFWKVDLVEEVIWLKTTVRGEPVTPLDALWRKPYEVLLLGRKRPAMTPVAAVKRRVIISVPDLHSRKPCLKSLIRAYMKDDEYSALEVFARYLVADWHSWGDECIKFNWEGNWQKSVVEPGREQIEVTANADSGI